MRVLEEIGLTGKLAGKQKNRVKPSNLRGILSEGILYPLVGKILHGGLFLVGDNVADEFHLSSTNRQFQLLCVVRLNEFVVSHFGMT